MKTPLFNEQLTLDINKNFLTSSFIFQNIPLNLIHNKKINKDEFNDNFLKQIKLINKEFNELISITNHNEIYLNKILFQVKNNESKNIEILSNLIFKENNPIYDFDMYFKIYLKKFS